MKPLRLWKNDLHFIGLLLAAVLFSTVALAQNGPTSLNLSGALYNPDGSPITNTSVNFEVDIYDTSGTCLLYTELHNAQNLSPSQGAFSLQVGSGTSIANKLEGNSSYDTKLFINDGTVVPTSTTCPSGATFAAGSNRVIRVSYNIGSGFVAMTPDIPVTNAPYAMIADTLQGLAPSAFIQTVSDSSNDLTQANVQSVFNSTNFPVLQSLLAGTDNKFISSTPTSTVDFNGQRLTNLSAPTTSTDAVTKSYADSDLGGTSLNMTGIGAGVGGGKVLVWDQVADQWVAQNVGSVSSITGGTGLLGGTITNSGTFSVDVGTGAGQIIQLNALAQIPALDGSLLSNINATRIGTRSVASTAPSAGQVLAYNATSSQWEPTLDSGITKLTGDVVATGPGSAVATIQANAVNLSSKINSSGIATNRLVITDSVTGTTLGYGTCLPGQVYQWTATGWACEDVSAMLGNVNTTPGTFGNATQVAQMTTDAQGRVTALTNVNIAFPVTSVAGRTGDVVLNAADISGLGSAALQNYGTAAGNLVQLDGTAHIPSSLLPNGTGTITSVIAGNAMIGGGSSGAVTLSADVGTVANKIVQFDSSAKYPSNDGSQITNVNASKIGTRTVSTTAPTAGQILGWDSANSDWEPILAATGSVTNIATGNGLLGGPIATNGTLSVDAGTTANKILQLNASAQIPSVDGSLVTNVNASKIGTRTVATTAPAANQVLGWNTTNSDWEPTSASALSVTSVVSGTGLVAGTITNTGTLNIDVGITANKIVQFTTGNQYPANDGSLITNVNASKIGTRTVSTTAPTAGQVLGWDTTNSDWEPILAATGSVTNISTGNGLLGGPIATNGTLSVDAGTTANKILQLNSSALIPAVDGSLVTNVNAAKIGTRTVATTAPAANQVLGWNATNSDWEPTSASSLSVTSVVSGAGLVAGTITNTGTLNVDVGVAANKIVQFTAANQYPADDGSLITNVNASKIGTRTVSTAAPAANQVLGWNTTNSDWEPTAASSLAVSSVVSGTGLVAGTITNTGTLNVDVGIAANKIVQFTAGNQYPANDGSLITNVNASKIGTRAVSTTAPTAGQVLGWDSANSDWEPILAATGSVTNIATGNGLTGGPISTTGTLSVDAGTTANKILQLNSSALIPAVDGSLVTNVNAAKIGTRAVATTAPAANQVLGWNTANSDWEPTSASTLSVTSVVSGTGLVAGTITNTGTLNVDVGVAANKIVQFTAANQYPANDGSLITNVNASKIGTRAVSTTAPTAGQVLGWDSANSDWEPILAATGSVTNIATGNGLTGGPITTSGTLSVDAGTTANKILQLNTSASIPAVDGSLVTNVNAAKIGTRTIATTAPAANQVLGWNTTNSDWEPTSASALSVTSVVSGTGLVAGTITNTGTLNVDVGIAANKIVQFTAGNQYPANDGSLITNVNASKIGTRTVSTTAPTAGQVLGWDTANSDWEPILAATGSVTNIATGNGLIGGPITTSGTLSVDAGTTANKILQLNASALIPAVDGSLVTNVNASKIGTRTVATTAPAANQVLGWNTANSDWEPISASALSVTSVVSGTGLVAGTITNTGTLNVDVGIAANKIVQFTAANQYPANDGSLITNVNASRIGTRTVSTTAPTTGQVLGWDTTNSDWEPILAATGSVTNISTGNGLLGGPIATNGTLSVDAGTTANKILQLNSSALIPAVDGSLVTNVNAAKIGTRTVSTAAPAANQVLGWNTTNSDWEPTAASSLAVSSVVSGTGLVAGTITNTGTLNVDVGIAANKIVQFTAANQYPANDGSLITNVNASKIGTRNVSTTAPTAGQVLGWDSANSDWEPILASTGSVTNIATGNGLTGGPITTSGTLSVDAGTTANKILQLNASALIPAVDGSLVTNVNAAKIGTRTVSIAAPAANQVLGWNTANSDWEPTSASSLSVTSVVSGTGLIAGTITNTGTLNVDVGIAANKIVQFTAANQYPANDGSLITNVNASKIGTRTVSTTAPTAGQVLGWDSANSDWEPILAATGSVTNIATGNGLTGGPISTTGTLSVDAGTTANKILQLNSSALIPAVDGSLVTNVNAAKIGTRTVASTAPAANQVLGWNATNSDWEPTSASTLSVTSVVSGTGLVAGTITNTGTLNVDVGIAANKIVQFTAANQYPANDGSLITNVNASKIGTRTVSTAAPTANQVLGWNTTNSDWEPTAGSSLSVSSVVSGTGLVAGTITNTGTLNVDVGTAANKIVQFTASAQYPANDGSLITNVNASNLIGKQISSTAPLAAQVLTYNSALGKWDAEAATAGASGFVNGGNSFGSAATLGTNDANSLTLKTNGAAAITILSNSYVGIGTTAPGSILDINGAMTERAIAAPPVSSAGQGVIYFDSTANKFMVSQNQSAYTALVGAAGGSGTVTSVSAGTGLVSGTITTSGTLNVDVGTAANKIVQFTAGAQYPANDGSLITNVNAGNLIGRQIASTAPTAGQILTYNSSLGKWDAETIVPATNTLASVTANGNTTTTASTFNGGLTASSLTVNGNSVTTGSSTVGGFLIENYNTSSIPSSGTGLAVGWNRSQGSAEVNFYNLYNSPGTAYTFSTKTGASTYSDLMTISGTGNVGIGTTAPGSTLDVNGVERVTQICDRSGANCVTPASLTAASTPNTLATVTANGSTTSTASTFNGGLTTSGITSTGEIVGTMGTGSGQARWVNGNYGLIERNDGSNFYFLLTASGSPYGTWSSLRPLTINDASGDVSLGTNLTVGGNATVSGAASITGSETLGGNLLFSAANPTISASSYVTVPGGAYFSSGTVYTQGAFEARGGVSNDSAAYLQVNGGTSGYTYFPNNTGIGTTSPGAKLEIQQTNNAPALSIGDSTIDDGATYGMVNLARAADTTRAHLAFIRSGNYVWQTGYVQNTNTLGFFPWNFSGTQGTPTLALAGAKVGVGTSAPDQALTVAGTIHTTGGVEFPDGTVQTTATGNPPGALLTMMTASCPAGYLNANGTAVSRSTYAALFAAIGSMYGAGDGSSTFNLPDMRGYFARGWDQGAGNDPDSSTRTTHGDGTTGDNVGTKEAGQVQSHTHGYNAPNQGYNINGGTQASSSYANGSASTTAAAGGNETRPKNINVLYCIKY